MKLNLPPGLLANMKAAAHREGLTPSIWAVQALYKQVYTDKKFYQGLGYTWPRSTGAHNPDPARGEEDKE